MVFPVTLMLENLQAEHITWSYGLGLMGCYTTSRKLRRQAFNPCIQSPDVLLLVVQELYLLQTAMMPYESIFISCSCELTLIFVCYLHIVYIQFVEWQPSKSVGGLFM